MDQKYPFGRLEVDDVMPEQFSRAVDVLSEVQQLDPTVVKDSDDFKIKMGLLGEEMFKILKSVGKINIRNVSSSEFPEAEIGEYVIEINDGGMRLKVWSTGKAINVAKMTVDAEGYAQTYSYSWTMPVEENMSVARSMKASVFRDREGKIAPRREYLPLADGDPESWAGFVSTIQRTIDELFASGLLDKLEEIPI